MGAYQWFVFMPSEAAFRHQLCTREITHVFKINKDIIIIHFFYCAFAPLQKPRYQPENFSSLMNCIPNASLAKGKLQVGNINGEDPFYYNVFENQQNYCQNQLLHWR